MKTEENKTKSPIELLNQFLKNTPISELETLVNKYKDLDIQGPTFSEYMNGLRPQKKVDLEGLKTKFLHTLYDCGVSNTEKGNELLSMYESSLSQQQFEFGFKASQEEKKIDLSELKVDGLNKVLSADGPYPLHEVMKYLIEGADILLHKKAYDGDGWEGLEYAYRKAKEIYPFCNQAVYEWNNLSSLQQPVERLTKDWPDVEQFKLQQELKEVKTLFTVFVRMANKLEGKYKGKVNFFVTNDQKKIKLHCLCDATLVK